MDEIDIGHGAEKASFTLRPQVTKMLATSIIQFEGNGESPPSLIILFRSSSFNQIPDDA
jgi:hypothetical protein